MLSRRWRRRRHRCARRCSSCRRDGARRAARRASPTNPVKAVKKPRQRSRRSGRWRRDRRDDPAPARPPRRHARLRARVRRPAARRGLALRWQNVRERTILIERSVSLGREKGTKTNATRTVRLLAPARGGPRRVAAAPRRPASDDELVFPRPDGQPWTDDDYRNWRERTTGRPPRPPASTSRAPTTCATRSSRC